MWIHFFVFTGFSLTVIMCFMHTAFRKSPGILLNIIPQKRGYMYFTQKLYLPARQNVSGEYLINAVGMWTTSKLPEQMFVHGYGRARHFVAIRGGHHFGRF